MNEINDLILKLVSLIPDDLNMSGMLNNPKERNEQKYCKENCKEYDIPFLPNFVDIDTYIESGKYRVQGYIKIKLTDFMNYSVEQLEYLIDLIVGAAQTEWSTSKEFPRLEIWNTSYLKN